jgi:tyrosyl-tRNA synthetase
MPTSEPADISIRYGEEPLTDEVLQAIIEENELYGKLLRSKISGEPLLIKLGVDPTAEKLHAGHGITLRMMRRFKQMGHIIQFIVGDATAMVGDSTDRMSARQPLTREQVLKNMESFITQASRILDLSPNNDKVEVYYNSSWINMEMMAWIPILSKMSASRAMQRRDFQSRQKKGGSVSLAELMYAAFMAYDSVHLRNHIEIIGLDQFLNTLQTRDLMRDHGLEPETVVTVDLLPGTTGVTDEDGRLVKMSKSIGNYIALEEDPTTLFTKVMGIPDSLMPIWLRELTEISSEELQALLSDIASKEINPKFYEKARLDPMEVKRMLAGLIVASLNYNDMDLVARAEKASRELVGKESKLRPDDAVKVTLGHNKTVLEFLEEIGKTDERLKSRGAIKKLVENKGISILVVNDETGEESYKLMSLEDLDRGLAEGTFIKVGKKSTFRVANEGED